MSADLKILPKLFFQNCLYLLELKSYLLKYKHTVRNPDFLFENSIDFIFGAKIQLDSSIFEFLRQNSNR